MNNKLYCPHIIAKEKTNVFENLKQMEIYYVFDEKYRLVFSGTYEECLEWVRNNSEVNKYRYKILPANPFDEDDLEFSEVDFFEAE